MAASKPVAVKPKPVAAKPRPLPSPKAAPMVRLGPPVPKAVKLGPPVPKAVKLGPPAPAPRATPTPKAQPNPIESFLNSAASFIGSNVNLATGRTQTPISRTKELPTLLKGTILGPKK